MSDAWPPEDSDEFHGDVDGSDSDRGISHSDVFDGLRNLKGEQVEIAWSAIDPSSEYEDDDEGPVTLLFTVVNPEGTVSVVSLIDGSIDRINLSESAASLTGSELAREIVLVAGLA